MIELGFRGKARTSCGSSCRGSSYETPVWLAGNYRFSGNRCGYAVGRYIARSERWLDFFLSSIRPLFIKKTTIKGLTPCVFSANFLSWVVRSLVPIVVRGCICIWENPVFSSFYTWGPYGGELCCGLCFRAVATLNGAPIGKIGPYRPFTFLHPRGDLLQDHPAY